MSQPTSTGQIDMEAVHPGYGTIQLPDVGGSTQREQVTYFRRVVACIAFGLAAMGAGGKYFAKAPGHPTEYAHGRRLNTAHPCPKGQVSLTIKDAENQREFARQQGGAYVVATSVGLLATAAANSRGRPGLAMAATSPSMIGFFGGLSQWVRYTQLSHYLEQVAGRNLPVGHCTPLDPDHLSAFTKWLEPSFKPEERKSS